MLAVVLIRTKRCGTTLMPGQEVDIPEQEIAGAPHLYAVKADVVQKQQQAAAAQVAQQENAIALARQRRQALRAREALAVDAAASVEEAKAQATLSAAQERRKSAREARQGAGG